MLTRLLSPPLMPLTRPLPTIVSAQSLRPSLSSIDSARCIFSDSLIQDGRRRRAAKRRVSLTVKKGNKLSSSCGTYEHIDRMTESVATPPLKSTFPEDQYFVPRVLCSLRAI